MGLNADDEILQDFLIEASELHEKLGEQLVDLEQRPDDNALLNAVFRGFHTIKGGAGFLNLTNLVALCHRAEDVFNVLRQGERRIDAPLMDVVLKVTDIVGQMLGQVRDAEEPGAADPALLAALEYYAKPAAQDVGAPPSLAPDAGAISDAADQDFDAMLASARPAGAVGGDDITEEEFEALLDQLHDAGKHKGVPNAATDAASAAASGATPPPVPTSVSGGDEISEEEFEALLDTLHGKPKHRGVPPVAPSAAPPLATAAPMVKQPEKTETADETQIARGVAQAGKETHAQADTTVRVDTKRLDDIMNLVGELVLVRNRLTVLKSELSNDDQIAKVVANLDLVTSDLQTAVMKTRMQPIKKVFGRFPRVVRDLARSLKKEVNLEMIGEETDLDKNLVEALADPLVHLVRNSVDHGIEPPEVRVAAGKSRAGTVVLAAKQEGDHILLSIEDDGAGMDAEVLRRKVVEKGLLDSDNAARLDKHECYNLIFLPGFSTKTEISDVSGRGVGMDVVKTRIAQLNGAVDIDSERGKGTKITIKVPLTLAIVPTLMVMLDDQIFALPLANISEIFDFSSTRVNTVDGRLVISVRDRTLPLVYLRDWLWRGRAFDREHNGFVVIVRIGIQTIGCVVDQLLGQEEVVIKPLGALLHGMQGLAGATITGNGRIALILDLPGLLARHASRY